MSIKSTADAPSVIDLDTAQQRDLVPTPLKSCRHRVRVLITQSVGGQALSRAQCNKSTLAFSLPAVHRQWHSEAIWSWVSTQCTRTGTPLLQDADSVPAEKARNRDTRTEEMRYLLRRGRSTELGLLDDLLLAALAAPELSGRCRSAELGRERPRVPAPAADDGGTPGRGLLERARCVCCFSLTYAVGSKRWNGREGDGLVRRRSAEEGRELGLDP